MSKKKSKYEWIPKADEVLPDDFFIRNYPKLKFFTKYLLLIVLFGSIIPTVVLVLFDTDNCLDCMKSERIFKLSWSILVSVIILFYSLRGFILKDSREPVKFTFYLLTCVLVIALNMILVDLFDKYILQKKSEIDYFEFTLIFLGLLALWYLHVFMAQKK